jgi:hypothetical protein
MFLAVFFSFWLSSWSVSPLNIWVSPSLPPSRKNRWVDLINRVVWLQLRVSNYIDNIIHSDGGINMLGVTPSMDEAPPPRMKALWEGSPGGLHVDVSYIKKIPWLAYWDKTSWTKVVCFLNLMWFFHMFFWTPIPSFIRVCSCEGGCHSHLLT